MNKEQFAYLQIQVENKTLMKITYMVLGNGQDLSCKPLQQMKCLFKQTIMEMKVLMHLFCIIGNQGNHKMVVTLDNSITFDNCSESKKNYVVYHWI